MERRVYFIAGDLLACVVAGAVAGWLTTTVIPVSWFPAIAMISAMAIGMLVGMLTAMILFPFFGAMELMLPCMLAGMVAGMVASMAFAMHLIEPVDATGLGAALGVLCLAGTYMMQWKLHGEAS